MTFDEAKKISLAKKLFMMHDMLSRPVVAYNTAGQTRWLDVYGIVVDFLKVERVSVYDGWSILVESMDDLDLLWDALHE